MYIWSGRNTLPPSSGRNEKDEYSIIEHVKLVVNKLYYQLSIICQKRIRKKNDAKKKAIYHKISFYKMVLNNAEVTRWIYYSK